MTYGTHPFSPMTGDDLQPTDYCERCGSHRRAHEAPPPAPATLEDTLIPEPGEPEAPKVYTMAAIAVAAGLSIHTIRSWRWRGRLPAEDGTVGTVPYWRAETIVPWLAANPRRRPGNPAWHKGMPSPGPRGRKDPTRQ